MEVNPLAQTPKTEEIKSRSARLTQAITSEAQAGLIKWQIESKQELQEMECYLLGYVWTIDEKGNQKLAQIGKQWCNAEGANALISIVKWYSDKRFILTNRPEDSVKAAMKDIAIALILYLDNWATTYGIADGDLTVLLNMILDAIEANLRRAIDMRTFDGFTTTYKTMEEFGKAAPPKKSFFSRFSSAFKLTK